MFKVLFGIALGWVLFIDQPWILEFIKEDFLFIIFVSFIACIISEHRQKKFIANYVFPEELDGKVLSVYPHLSKEELNIAKEELRHFFGMRRIHVGQMVAMPSRIVDVVWHEFILYSKDYSQFCKQGFGSYFHHDPFSKETASKDVVISLQRAWLYSCKEKNIDPEDPHQLPLLFSIDSLLNISDGNEFSLENRNELTESSPSNSNLSLKCTCGSYVGLGVFLLVSRINSDEKGSGGGGCGG